MAALVADHHRHRPVTCPESRVEGRYSPGGLGGEFNLSFFGFDVRLDPHAAVAVIWPDPDIV